jgi:hypothetical protein
MAKDRDFLLQEAQQIEAAISLTVPLLSKQSLDPYEAIALGTLLQNVYMGIENILRCQLHARGIHLPKTANWHKELLRAACEAGLVNEEDLPVFRNLLLFRHRHVHGYGHMLEEFLLRQLADPVPEAVRRYIDRVKASLD